MRNTKHLISSILLLLLLSISTVAHPSGVLNGQDAPGGNASLFLWQGTVLLAINDRDHDGYDDAHDEFPDDSSEHSDHDKDQVGDNKDIDKDGDGYLNKHEELAGSDPLDEKSVPADMDGDFLPDVIDPDIDGDGVPNAQDLNPTNPAISTDTIAPVITIPAAVMAEATGQNTMAVIGTATVLDNIDGIVPVTSNAPASFPLGTTTVTYSATDAAGNTATATQLVTVVDTTAPVVTAPAATGASGTGQPVAVSFGQATATDAFAVTITNNAPASFPVGATTVTWTATDANGNSATATQLITITINDVTPPSITVPANVNVEATGISTSVTLGAASAIDNIDGVVAVTNNAPAAFPLGITTVIYSATDAAGNTATATQLVTVVDTTAPAIVAPAGASGASGNNQPVAVAIGQATATDTFAVTITNDAPALFPVGTTTVSWTATDANGNSATATQLVTVTINDVMPPTITAPANVTAEATGAITFILNIGWATASDVVDPNVTVVNDAPVSYPLGTTVVTWAATDASGSSSTAVQNIIVQDTTIPVVTAPAPVTLTSTGGNPVSANIGQASATDLFAVTVTNNAPATFPVGTTTVTWTATDANGNSATATQRVTVSNAVAPFTFIAPPDLVLQTASASGIPSGQITFGRPTVQSTVAVSWTRSFPSTFPIGISQVNWKATGANGNVINAVQQVTVNLIQDTTPPVISVPADIQLTSIDGNPVPASIGQATATDNLPGPVTLTQNAPALFPVGTTTVIWTATDAAGNSSTAMQLVVVVWNQQYLANLPPDPGPAGKATLAGIDSDNDGVRDDVQRWIALTYSNSQKTRAALTQMAKSTQRYLLDAANPALTHLNALEVFRASSCLAYIWPDFYQKSRQFDAKFLNTNLRTKTSLQADHHLSGSFFSDHPDEKQGCNFNPDTMPN